MQSGGGALGPGGECAEAESGAASPETGSGGAAAGGERLSDDGSAAELPLAANSAGGPVGRDAPNIPNVVEYHLKVKPQPQHRKEREDRQRRASLPQPADTGRTVS